MKDHTGWFDNWFGTRYWWKFYEVKGWNDRELVERHRFTTDKAWEYSRENQLLFEIDL